MTDAAVTLTGISKRYGAVVANDSVDLVLRRGSVHAVMGENGAGKSTLMSILFGLTEPDAGTIEVGGVERRFRGPADAIAAGLGMVHQHFRLFDSMSVAENVVYGAEPTRGALLDRRAAAERVRELSDRYGLGLDPDANVGRLSAGVRQRVEIVKALHREAEILILDEPSAVLTPDEVTSLFSVIRRAADAGTTVVLVTHKIQEVLAISDEVTVLRAGRVSGRFATAEVTGPQLIEAMTGRDVVPVSNAGARELGGIALSVDRATVVEQGITRLDDVSLTVRTGEIVGVAGVSGNGQHELVEAVLGAVALTSGTVEIAGTDVSSLDVRRRRLAGLAVIPEDRRGEGTAVTMTTAENITAGHHRSAPISGSGLAKGWLKRRAQREEATRLMADYDVRAESDQSLVGALSGGNAQKVVVARELSHGAPVLIAEQPTQGVDVGAIESIHTRLLEYRDAGRAVLLVSHEITELQALADRVVVLFAGRLVAEFSRAEATTARIGAAMTGGVTSGSGDAPEGRTA